MLTKADRLRIRREARADVKRWLDLFALERSIQRRFDRCCHR